MNFIKSLSILSESTSVNIQKMYSRNNVYPVIIRKTGLAFIIQFIVFKIVKLSMVKKKKEL